MGVRGRSLQTRTAAPLTTATMNSSARRHPARRRWRWRRCYRRRCLLRGGEWPRQQQQQRWKRVGRYRTCRRWTCPAEVAGAASRTQCGRRVKCFKKKQGKILPFFNRVTENLQLTSQLRLSLFPPCTRTVNKWRKRPNWGRQKNSESKDIIGESVRIWWDPACSWLVQADTSTYDNLDQRIKIYTQSNVNIMAVPLRTMVPVYRDPRYLYGKNLPCFIQELRMSLLTCPNLYTFDLFEKYSSFTSPLSPCKLFPHLRRKIPANISSFTRT